MEYIIFLSSLWQCLIPYLSPFTTYNHVSAFLLLMHAYHSDVVFCCFDALFTHSLSLSCSEKYGVAEIEGREWKWAFATLACRECIYVHCLRISNGVCEKELNKRTREEWNDGVGWDESWSGQSQSFDAFQSQWTFFYYALKSVHASTLSEFSLQNVPASLSETLTPQHITISLSLITLFTSIQNSNH